MKRWLYIFFFVACCSAHAGAQGSGSGRGGFSLAGRNAAAQLPDSLYAGNDEATGESRIRAYRLSELGERYPVPMDTGRLNTANSTLIEGLGVAVAHTGNVGSPMQSRIFTERGESRDFIFADPYDAYIITPRNGYFYDTKIPYSNILYTRAGSAERMEEQLKILLSSNFGRKINVGGDFDYIYSRGFYNSNGNKMINYRIFGNYRSDHYEAFAHLRNFNMVGSENGGLTNDRYVTHPDEFADGKRQVDTKSYPTRFTSTWNRVRGKNFFLSHRYNLGFYRSLTARETEQKRLREEERRQQLLEEEEDAARHAHGQDATATQQPEGEEEEDEDVHANEVFVPVSSIIHTVEYEDNRRRFISYYPTMDSCYKNIYGAAGELPNDTASAWRIRNTFALSMREGFHDWVKFGLAFFAGFESRSFSFAGDSVADERRYSEFLTFVGGEISKQRGDVLTFSARGEFGVAGRDAGELRVNGNIRTRFSLAGQEASLEAAGFVRNVRPAFFQQRYASRYFRWDSPLEMTQHVHAEGTATVERTRTRLSVGVDNIRNYVYFSPDGAPAQFGGNIQIVTARLRQDFRYRALGWENELVGQLSSEKDVLPLPQLSVYTNLYAAFKLFGVLSVQLGADAHYFTAYYSPVYEPATQQFINQNQMRTGDYPLISAYANFHLKQTRFFVTGYNVGSLFIDHPAYFSMPHYPMNPMCIKLGLSVMFNN
ncbi:MAG: putative porin [Tannerella sp.]|nr:putative porin [Tannerella sp.]